MMIEDELNEIEEEEKIDHNAEFLVITKEKWCCCINFDKSIVPLILMHILMGSFAFACLFVLRINDVLK